MTIKVLKTMKGLFELSKATDLLQKLHYEFEQLKKEPDNTYVAFNFFVTAEHILDWLYPKRSNKKKREQVRENSVLLQICSHIANGSKHFEVEDLRHKSVSGTNHMGGHWPNGYFPKDYFPNGYFPDSNLIIRLEGDAKNQFGESISVIKLAAIIVEFWDKHPDLKT